jgi:hypothetical protein
MAGAEAAFKYTAANRQQSSDSTSNITKASDSWHQKAFLPITPTDAGMTMLCNQLSANADPPVLRNAESALNAHDSSNSPPEKAPSPITLTDAGMTMFSNPMSQVKTQRSGPIKPSMQAASLSLFMYPAHRLVRHHLIPNDVINSLHHLARVSRKPNQSTPLGVRYLGLIEIRWLSGQIPIPSLFQEWSTPISVLFNLIMVLESSSRPLTRGYPLVQKGTQDLDSHAKQVEFDEHSDLYDAAVDVRASDLLRSTSDAAQLSDILMPEERNDALLQVMNEMRYFEAIDRPNDQDNIWPAEELRCETFGPSPSGRSQFGRPKSTSKAER